MWSGPKDKDSKPSLGLRHLQDADCSKENNCFHNGRRRPLALLGEGSAPNNRNEYEHVKNFAGAKQGKST